MSDFLRIDHSLFLAEGDVFHTPIIYRRKFNYLQLFSIVMLSSRRIYCHGFLLLLLPSSPLKSLPYLYGLMARVARATHTIYQMRQFLNNQLYQRQCVASSMFRSSLAGSWDGLNLKISVNDEYKNNSKGFFFPRPPSLTPSFVQFKWLGNVFWCLDLPFDSTLRIKSSQTVKISLNDYETLTGWTLQISFFWMKRSNIRWTFRFIRKFSCV